MWMRPEAVVETGCRLDPLPLGLVEVRGEPLTHPLHPGLEEDVG